MSNEIAAVPRQDGRVAVVTGTGGLGFEAALALASAGAEIVLGGRNAAAGQQAVARIKAAEPAVDVRFVPLDLASLASVAEFAGALRGKLDILLCNAGIMSPPERRTTADGFELQFGVNYLGHFALTARLLPLLRASEEARVVSVISLAHRYAKLDFEDLQSERGYKPGVAYCRSKLAQALFAKELQRRSDKAGWRLTSVAAHPGMARTNLFAAHGKPGLLNRLGTGLFTSLFGQSAAMGAAPLIYGATSPEVAGGQLYGPKGLFEMKGPPGLCEFAPAARDPETAARLWSMSEQLAGVRFGEPAATLLKGAEVS